jgi:hypothetical protein
LFPVGVEGAYTDLERSLLGRVEELIDFVTARDTNRVTRPGLSPGRVCLPHFPA